MTNWWDEFFLGDWEHLQPQMWTSDETRASVDLIERLLNLSPSAAVLDVPCGEGRIALELARRGYSVTGLDISDPMLEIARVAAEKESLNVDWRRGDMRELPWETSFDGVVCWWGSFGYFDDSGNRAFLEAVARTLRPGARLLIESPWMDSLLPMWQRRSWDRIGDSLMLQDRRFDSTTGRIESEWTIIHDGVETVQRASIRLYPLRELIELCRSVGFSDAGAVTETGEDYEFGNPGRLFVATR